MLPFYADDFLVVYDNLRSAESTVEAAILTGKAPPHRSWETLEYTLVNCLLELGKICERLPVSSSFRYQIERARECVSCSKDSVKTTETLTRVEEIRENLRSEIEGHRFYLVPSGQVYLMEPGVHRFGEKVHEKFPGAAKDISASGRCLALDEWTACVFHSMRALEHGLWRFAKYVGLPKIRKAAAGMAEAKPLELEQWHTIIDQIEKAIRSMGQQKKTAARDKKLKFCSEAAHQFRYFKDAWRNHVSHSRASYDSREADSIWKHTKEFMEHLAENL